MVLPHEVLFAISAKHQVGVQMLNDWSILHLSDLLKETSSFSCGVHHAKPTGNDTGNILVMKDQFQHRSTEHFTLGIVKVM